MLLFYAPEVLHTDAALMRVLVDKHFVGESSGLGLGPGCQAACYAVHDVDEAGTACPWK